MIKKIIFVLLICTLSACSGIKKDNKGKLHNKVLKPNQKMGLNSKSKSTVAMKKPVNSVNIQGINKAKKPKKQVFYRDTNMNYEYITSQMHIIPTYPKSALKLSKVDKSNINSLLKSRGKKVLYVIMHNIFSKNNKTSVNQRFLVMSFARNIQEYIFNKFKVFNNFYLKFVYVNDIPEDEVMLIEKPVSDKVFKSLGSRQNNIFNAKRENSKQWLRLVKQAEADRVKKDNKLYQVGSK